jgi:CubicO group peptidase (beta-lactamase class C family)
VQEFAAHLEALASADEFSGVVLVDQRGKHLLEEAHGLADRDLGIPIQLDTKFNLGSMNKMFTAVAILQLVEQGKLSVDDYIIDVLPDYPNQKVAAAVTIDQLLNHTAGMGDCFTGDFFTTPAGQLKTVAGYLPLFVDKPLQFEPGSQYAYSNDGYIVLGLIIEQITGQSYFDYVRDQVYLPAGMVNTDAYELDAPVPGMALGYTTQDAEGNQTGELAVNTPLMPVKGTPAGGGYSTAGDLLAFKEALLGDKLLSPEYTKELLGGKVAIRANVEYAYGFMDKLIAGQRIVGHGGNAPGVCDLMDIYLDSGYTIIVLSNTDEGCLNIRNYLLENPLRPVPITPVLTTDVSVTPTPTLLPAQSSAYLGQIPPGLTPQIFAPGIISLPSSIDYAGAFSPDGTEFYFTRRIEDNQNIYETHLTNGVWSEPAPVSFSAGDNAHEPHLTFDNQTLYFGWFHPLPPEEDSDAGYGIWATDRTTSGWSEPRYVGQGMFVSSDRSGQMYVTNLTTSPHSLSQVTLVDGRFTEWESITAGAHPCIAPDGSYLVYDRGGGEHLYVKFHLADGTWGESIDLAKQGIPLKAGIAMISPDGQYLFYVYEGDLYWVSTELIANLKPN